ncbi:MAG: MopE-related protein [Myxococcota bacterium]|nr:MopE-related protein [Myxococcota bacterium]
MSCEAGFVDRDGRTDNGCEYRCTPADPPEEVCNARDDDCDGEIDEGDPGGGASCGTDVGACEAGRERCMGGTLVCAGSVGPSTERCNGVDDDCDGEVDEGNPEGGADCGSGVGACVQGREQCLDGRLQCVGAIGPRPETCNGLDDDCDGTIDDGDPDGGGACGSSVGECRAGVLRCRGGVVVCEGATDPAEETCNGLDDDCDGMVDDGDPEGGASCGLDEGDCEPGVRRCMGGRLECVGATTGGPEVCDGRDNDCDGMVDDGDPGGGASCGTDVGECVAGRITCVGGALVCRGAVGPAPERCNGRDDDCDGMTDEDFSLSTDVNNCGACGRACGAANAIARCEMGSCRYTCRTGFVDLNGDVRDGCEYACDFAGAEICNGRDDDCDGMTDEGLTPPTSFCNPNGVCAGTRPTCGGSRGWECRYPGTYESTETRCDGLDNDCDGAVDEPFPLRGTSCTDGELGICRGVGTYQCNAMGTGVTCVLSDPGMMARAETCNGLDDDCDGVLDDGAPDAWVRLGSANVWVYQYEASRPDATAGSAGSMSHRPCSAAGRLPWTHVSYAEARAACMAIGADLCTEAQWQQACQSSSGSCTWSYASMCTVDQPGVCNTDGYDTSSAPGDQDAVLPTGSRPDCYAAWGASARIFDMTGNVEEWALRRSPGVNPIRGGSTTSPEGGSTCTFNFKVASDAFRFPMLGFRCCRTTAP